MSGVLRRLADRAWTGSTPAVHSMARMPYVAPLERNEAEDGPAVERATSRSPRERAREARAPAPSIRRGRFGVTEPDDPPRGPTAAPQRPGAPDEPSPEGVSANRDRAADRETVEIVVALPEERIPEEIASCVLRAVAPTLDPLAPDGSGDRAEVRVPRAADSPARESDAGRNPQSPRPTSPAGEPRPVRSPSASTRPGAHPPTEDHEATEVHVHIGRIEVTAVQESVPVRRSRKPDRKPMTLDDYLEKRRGRSS